MNNKHQELIDKKVAELDKMYRDLAEANDIGWNRYYQAELDDYTSWLTKTLQQTIDTVLAEERERWIKAVGEKIDKTTRELMMASFREGVEETTNQFEAAMKAMTSTKIVDKALDKTLPNKV